MAVPKGVLCSGPSRSSSGVCQGCTESRTVVWRSDPFPLGVSRTTAPRESPMPRSTHSTSCAVSSVTAVHGSIGPRMPDVIARLVSCASMAAPSADPSAHNHRHSLTRECRLASRGGRALVLPACRASQRAPLSRGCPRYRIRGHLPRLLPLGEPRVAWTCCVTHAGMQSPLVRINGPPFQGELKRPSP